MRACIAAAAFGLMARWFARTMFSELHLSLYLSQQAAAAAAQKAAEEEAKELKLKLDAVNASNVEVRVCLALLVIVIVFAGGIWGARGSPHLPRVLDRARTSSSSRRLDRPRSSWSSPSWQSPSWQSPHHHARTPPRPTTHNSPLTTHHSPLTTTRPGDDPNNTKKKRDETHRRGGPAAGDAVFRGEQATELAVRVGHRVFHRRWAQRARG